MLERSCYAGVSDCWLALWSTGTGSGLGFFLGISTSGISVSFGSAGGRAKRGTGGFLGLGIT